ncbi:hypothetical protein UMM65_10730 [Aureibaculum sp. 2210JD6-5]|uniref:hypothetical protein n=1 Tax=Aureibaculum sp. 2210JD6-5 TaxID=3103957 RepID=UPI002AAC772C|nr:hypothetical protein [Aureibaculum sp. 2210JD6-5]MDY7395719.1 hypothetical protein [Aureibaculum sp. 2210JD6-5]
MKTIFQIALITINILITGCALNQIKKSDDTYIILNSEINRLTNKKEDTIYLRKITYNRYLKSLLKEKKLVSNVKNLELIEAFTKEEEINYLVQQLEDSLLINFNKINSKLVKEHIDPFSRRDSSGNIVTDYYYIKIFGSRKYSFSKPIFSKNRKYCFLIVSRDKIGVGLRIYKQENNKWKFFRNIGLSIS